MTVDSKQIPYAFNTLGHVVRVCVRDNVDLGVAVGLCVCVGLAAGLSDGVAVTVVVGVGVRPGVAAAGSTVYRSVLELSLATEPRPRQAGMVFTPRLDSTWPVCLARASG
jgi:hypothetical protein